MGSLLLSEPTLASRKKKKKRRGGEERRRVKWKRKGKEEKGRKKKKSTPLLVLVRLATQYLYPRRGYSRFLDTRGIIKAKYLDPRERKIFEEDIVTWKMIEK